jgi:hypothetical protein
MTTKLTTKQILHGVVPLDQALDQKVGVSVDFSTSWDPAAVAPSSYLTQTFTVTGALMNDFSHHSFSQNLSGLIMSSYVSAPDQATVILFNPTAGSINIAGGTLKLRLTRSA